MSKSKKKKNKKKPKLVYGAVLSQMGSVQGPNAVARPLDEAGLYQNEDKGMNTLKSIPIIGGLTSSAMGISSGIRGDGTNIGANLGATVFSPTSTMRAAKDAGASGLDTIGAAFNPIGGAIMTAKLRKKQMADLAMQRQAPIVKQMIANSGQTQFAAGGQMMAPELKPLRGGQAEKISPDAVEFKGNEPSKTDKIELPTAFVDHGEVGDNEGRIFSDTLKTSNGKTYAKQAKALEKMKDPRSRYSNSNKRIDEQVEALFQEQEAQKKGGIFDDGGALDFDFLDDAAHKLFDPKKGYLRSLGPALDKLNPVVDPIANKFNELMDGKKKPKKKLYDGGEIDTSPLTNMYVTNPLQNHNVAGIPEWKPTLGPSMQTLADRNIKPRTLTPPTGNGPINQSNVNWGQIATGVATAAPNIANAFLQRRLKGPAAPRLENDVTLNRISADPELNAANRAYNQARALLTKNTAQGANLASGLGNIYAKRLAAQNQTYGQVNAMNAQIGNQEAFMNQQSRFRNNVATNIRNQAKNDFENKKLMMTSDNIANLSGKIQANQRERNQMTRDKQALEFMQLAYGDSQVMARLEKNNPALYNSIWNTMGGKKSNKLGGKLTTKKKR